MLYQIYSALVWCMSFVAFYGLYRGGLVVYLCMVNDIARSRGDETPASSESRLFAIERSERAKGVL